ncbi:MAG: LuxR C-terminal-related transcriptional regulator [Firmicutes bacterium]|nr:LuxR C-terminal-related transcriptional regulator [Bacillota bacterium]
MVIYTTAWPFAVIWAQEHYWDVISICDKVDIGLSIAGILCCILAFVQGKCRDTISVIYGIIVLTLNISSFYWKEDPMLLNENIYLFTWIGIAFATLAYIIYVVKSEKSKSVSHAQEKIIDIDDAYRKLREAYGLTKREEEILREIYSGKSNQQIASDLCISEATVKAHIHNLLGKMSVGSRVEAIVAVQKEMYL